MRQGVPRVSFGLPVRDGERFLRRALESLGRQEYSDFEVVIADNQSSDATPDIAREFASQDARFRYIRNETDIGQIENFNRVFELSRGPFFRWIGSDDWVEPSYTGRCVAALRHELSDRLGESFVCMEIVFAPKNRLVPINTNNHVRSGLTL